MRRVSSDLLWWEPWVHIAIDCAPAGGGGRGPLGKNRGPRPVSWVWGFFRGDLGVKPPLWVLKNLLLRPASPCLLYVNDNSAGRRESTSSL